MWFKRSIQTPAQTSSPLFADSARAAIEFARAESARLQHEYIGSEHLVLGLLLPGSRGEGFLQALDVDPGVIRTIIEAQCPVGRDRNENPPYTSRGKKVLELAVAEAMQEQVSSIEAEFLVLGLLLEQKGIGAQVLLRDGGLTIELVREAIRNPLATSFRVTVSGSSNIPLVDQIVVQIEQAIASGQLTEGNRLPTVRGLARTLDVAPGTVARAFAELEKRGIVKTDGARGTTVAKRVNAALGEQQRVMLLSGMFKPIAVEGFHLGATAEEMREALERVMRELKLPPA